MKQNKKMNYKCEICAVTFDSSHVCNKIVDLMESPESNDRTKSRLDLPKTSSYEGKKPFKCEICGKSFTNNSNLVRHIGSVHNTELEQNEGHWKHVSTVFLREDGKKTFK